MKCGGRTSWWTARRRLCGWTSAGAPRALPALLRRRVQRRRAAPVRTRAAAPTRSKRGCAGPLAAGGRIRYNARVNTSHERARKAEGPRPLHGLGQAALEEWARARGASDGAARLLARQQLARQAGRAWSGATAARALLEGGGR